MKAGRPRTRVHFDPTGERLAAGSGTEVRLYDNSDGEHLGTLETKTVRYRMQWDESGESLATLGYPSEVTVWQLDGAVSLSFRESSTAQTCLPRAGTLISFSSATATLG